MDIGANNPQTFYETPNIDRLAAKMPDKVSALRQMLHDWRNTVDATMPTPKTDPLLWEAFLGGFVALTVGSLWCYILLNFWQVNALNSALHVGSGIIPACVGWSHSESDCLSI